MTVAEDSKHSRSPLRIGISVAVLLVIGAYTLLVLSGSISPDRRIDTVHLVILLSGLLACVALLNPDLTDRLRLLEVRGFKIELLDRIQERQLRQEQILEDIRLIIPLLFRDAERKHLSNVARGKTAEYHGGAAVREELRRMCSIGLLQRRGGHKIAELRSDLVFDLGEYVELTELGRRWVRRLAELQDVSGDTADSAK
jgi:hypothetical protein